MPKTATRAPITEEATSRFAQLGDLKIHYNEVGEGYPVVMLHGGGPGASSWSNFKYNVPELSEDFRLLLVDQPGFGKSDKPLIDEGVFTFNARAVRDLLDHLGIDQAHVVGNSLGAGTTFKFALDYPDRANRLVMMGGAAVNFITPINIGGNVASIVMDFYAAPSREKMIGFMQEMLYDHTLITDDLIDERLAAATAPDTVESMKNLFEGILTGKVSSLAADADMWKRVAEVPHTSLLTWGRDDRILPLDAAFPMLKMMPDCRLHVFPRCGHWAQAEWSEEWTRLVRDFLNAA